VLLNTILVTETEDKVTMSIKRWGRSWFWFSGSQPA